MLRSLPGGDFTAETRINGINVSQRAQSYGILLWQNSSNYIRFEFWNYGSITYAAAWRVSNGAGTAAFPGRALILGAANLIRLTRTADSFQMEYSTNGGSSWTTAGSFSQPGFNPDKIGLEATNYEFNPATTANFDYFSLATN
jgi:hypothetical protein